MAPGLLKGTPSKSRQIWIWLDMTEHTYQRQWSHMLPFLDEYFYVKK